VNSESERLFGILIEAHDLVDEMNFVCEEILILYLKIHEDMLHIQPFLPRCQYKAPLQVWYKLHDQLNYCKN